MGSLTVLDVGDGACSVIRRLNECAVIDCGNWQGRHREASSRLARFIESQNQHYSGGLESIVVTHFDADHWMGLQLLPKTAKPNFPWSPNTNLYYPNMPFDAPNIAAASLAMFLTQNGTGVRAADLVTALGSSTKLHRVPLSEGDCFSMLGIDFEVMWPPTHLHPKETAALSRAVHEIESIAKDLDDAGYPRLLENLEATYRIPFPGRVRSSDDATDDPITIAKTADEDDLAGSDREIESDSQFEDNLTTHSHETQPLGNIPEGFRERFKSVSRRAARANNDLSLVFRDKENRLLVLGDASKGILTRLTHQVGFRDHFEIMLAPHHGTVEIPPRFACAEWCVAQAADGPRGHWNRWWKHLDSHDNCGLCVSTAELGTITVKFDR